MRAEFNDMLIVVLAFAAFIVFLVIHFISFRFLRPEDLLKGIVKIFLGNCCLLTGAGVVIMHAPAAIKIFSILLTLCIFSLLAFFYILCIFGPYETSIRMRLIRELSTENTGLKLQDLLKQYNTAVILDTRLKRLLGSGDLIQRQDRFYLGKSSNIFFIIDWVSIKLREFIHAK